MRWDKKHYKSVKDFVSHQLNNRPWCVNTDCPVEWAKTFLPVISDCIHGEDYEAAQAASDAIREFLNQFLDEPIKENAQLKLPDFKPLVVQGIVCFVDGTAQWPGGEQKQ
jgi:hypothetical protein